MKKILLVDDSRALRTLVARHLREQGWQVLEADDGLEGVMLALQHQPDLILLDVAMPHLDGPGALLKIRSKQSVRNTPVIMMTAAADRETVMKLARLGIQDYIVKPFTIDLMLSKVYKIFAQLAEERAEEQTPEPSPEPDEGQKVGAEPSANGQPFDHPERPNLLTVGISSSLSDALRLQLSDRLDVYVARDADQAIQMLNTYPPHAVLLDLNQSPPAAVEAYKRLKYLPSMIQTPFVVLQALDPVIQDKGERAGMTTFLPPNADPDTVFRLLEALEKERQEGRYGSNYVQTVQGFPVLRWPETIKLEKLRELTWEVEDNLGRTAELGQLKLVVNIGAVKQFHDGHLLLILAVQRKASALGLKLAFSTQNEIARQFFLQYEDTRSIVFHPTLEAAWASIV